MVKPLAVALRPTTLKNVLGQKHLLNSNGVINRIVEKKHPISIIFFGPPGTGKTTIATCIANDLEITYRMFNAATGNKKEMDAIIEEAKLSNGLLLIVDEVHRMNKDKQDHLLPHIESGLITMIGCTTANPYHSINPAIRSRCHLLEVKELLKEDLRTGIEEAIISEHGLNNQYEVTEEAIDKIIELCGGDIRFAYNCLEICSITTSNNIINLDIVDKSINSANVRYDRSEDFFYDTLSAFQKSIRGSDADAALYYLAKLVAVGDLESIERRLITTAYEDIGLANPAACARVVQAIDAAKRIGFPEGRIPLAVSVIELALSPKSKSADIGIDLAIEINESQSYSVPEYLRLTPVGLSDDQRYSYDRQDLWEYIQYLPNGLENTQFYIPWMISNFEKQLAEQHKRIREHGRSSNIIKLNNTKQR